MQLLTLQREDALLCFHWMKHSEDLTFHDPVCNVGLFDEMSSKDMSSGWTQGTAVVSSDVLLYILRAAVLQGFVLIIMWSVILSS